MKDESVIGIKLNICLMCGNSSTNRHHVIPKAMKPKYNVTIPLCDEHKDCLHPTVKQFYFPKELRAKIGTINKLSDNLNKSIMSLREKLKFHKSNKTQSSITVPNTSSEY